MEDFEKIVKDFVKDLMISFPELKDQLGEDLKNVVLDNENKEECLTSIFEHCKKRYPERFFDILYENDSIFDNDDMSIDFLPGIDFKLLWKEELTEKTRECIWKYLQLILFTVAGDLTSNDSFGDTAKLFEAIDENELKSKLEETVKTMHDMFSNTENGDISSSDASFSMPNPDDIHSHINEMFQGKIGNLAKEIADETMEGMNIDINNPEKAGEIFKNLLKDPTKLMSLVKSVGEKLDAKLKSGEVKETELLQEAGEMLKKMKTMPGMSNMEAMFKNMGVPMPGGAGGKGKMNFGAMEGKLQQQMRQAKLKERMRDKLQENNKKGNIPFSAMSDSQAAAEVEQLMNTVFADGQGVTTKKSSKTVENSGKRNKKKKGKKNK